MILGLILSVILIFLNLILQPFPVVEEMPFGLDPILSQGFSGFRALNELFPVLGLFMELTLVYLGFKILLIVLKFVLGHRSPHV